MSAASIIINQYAKAAFSAAKKSGLQDKFLSDLKLFSDNFSQEISKELSNPAISRENLVDVIAIFCEKLSINSKVADFLKIIAKARRIKYLKAIYQQFLKLYKSDKNILEVKLYSVTELDSDQLNQVKTLLQKKYPQKTIEINSIIDPKILGGIVIQIDSKVIDASLKNQLLSIEKECNSIIT